LNRKARQERKEDHLGFQNPKDFLCAAFAFFAIFAV
jgi:hypothetical protein